MGERIVASSARLQGWSVQARPWSVDRLLPGVAGVLALLVLAMLWQGMHGVRGVDQHWYLADTETLMRGGKAHTNTVFPGLVLRAGSADAATAILHNSPLLHLHAAIARVTGAFQAWKLGNGAMLLLTATLTGAGVNALAGGRWATIAFATYVCSPLALWQAANLFQETFLALLMSMLLFLLIMRARWRGATAAAFLVLAIGCLSHPIFTVLAATATVWLLVTGSQRSTALLGGGACLLAAPLYPLLFPSSFQPDLASIIGSAVPGQSNMLWHLSEALPVVDTGLLWLKLTDAVHLQFLTVEYWPFTCLSILGLISTSWWLATRRRHRTEVLGFIVLSYALVTTIAVLMQNLPRYQLLLTPAAVTSIAMMAASLPRQRVWLAAFAAGTALFLVSDYKLMDYLDRSIEHDRVNAERMLEEIGPLPLDARVVAIDRKATDIFVPLITALAPRPVMLVDRNLLSPSGIERALRLFVPDIIVTTSRYYQPPLGIPLRRLSSALGDPMQTGQIARDLPAL